MKKVLLFIGIPLVLSSCVKQLDKTFKGETVVEIDAAPLNSNATGATYPILTRIPFGGRPLVTASDSTLRRFNGTVRIRVNLVGPQSPQDQTIGYKVFTTSPTPTAAFAATMTGQTPTRAAATLNLQSAAAGTHFTALPGTVTIPANSSYGFIEVNVLNTGTAATEARFLGIQLDSTGSLRPNPNYARVGLAIDQR
ncbi:DUF4843 domain-containing protein [Terrimonas sp. NA20]|uniref:DUF4843 domain-containing protein n=1 Tax=Terrimonas ginsenosidimutans TaxID=2908004 RepID=A0ABS9KVS6_9BACT|nr:DUF4843 domain-containing protein [Terrimonas ginsenosidimutans]MCG2616359.1 DUF4843 domain-containing protein [Terrimonas ginsenosidimutans]